MMSNKTPQSLVEFVTDYYNEPHRSYHTIDHITRIFDDVDRHNIVLTPNQQVAILFHDIIYTPGSKTNEEDSARMLRLVWKKHNELFDDVNNVSLYSRTFNVQVAERIITDTAAHISTTAESKVVIDLDLLGLADNYDQYIEAGQRVREEFMHLDNKDWLIGRRAFLRSFLDRNYIFQTISFRQLYEAKARKNLHTELESIT